MSRRGVPQPRDHRARGGRHVPELTSSTDSASRDRAAVQALGLGGRVAIDGVIFHTDRGSTYTASSFTLLCKDKLGVRQSMGRVGSCFDNAAAE
jgi:transposase InsO family protein